jgi:multidrug efflux pump subunit AcrA (membrane-fusion protein)
MESGSVILPRWMLLTVMAGSLCILIWLEGCERKQPSPPSPPSVSVARPLKEKVTDYIEAFGNTEPVQTAQLRARVAGYLEKVFFRDTS